MTQVKLAGERQWGQRPSLKLALDRTDTVLHDGTFAMAQTRASRPHEPNDCPLSCAIARWQHSWSCLDRESTQPQFSLPIYIDLEAVCIVRSSVTAYGPGAEHRVVGSTSYCAPSNLPLPVLSGHRMI